MDHPNITFIPGHPNDAEVAATLIYESSHELLGFMFQGRETAIRVLTKLYKKKHGHFSHVFSRLAIIDGQVVGLELGYGQDQLVKQEWIGGVLMLLHTPLSLWWHLLVKVGSVVDNYVPKPTPGSYYLNNLAVATEKRSAGIGRILLEESMRHAKASGYRSFEGDVTKVNTRAIKFYEEQGLTQLSESCHQEAYEKLGLPPLIRMMHKFYDE
jgi:ribosomal protein S18 acetylase RimI-like enzyme